MSGLQCRRRTVACRPEAAGDLRVAQGRLETPHRAEVKNHIMQRNKKGIAPWQTRWIALHDDVHLLEVLLEAIIAGPEYLTEYWSLSADVINFGQDLQDAYETALAADGQTGNDDDTFFGLRRRLTHLQARAQALSLENDVE